MSARDRLGQIEARTNAATEGPWDAQPFDDAPGDWGSAIIGGGADTMRRHLTAYTMTYGDEQQTIADAEFIAAARADVPWLVAKLRAVLDLHKPAYYWCHCRDAGDQTDSTVRHGCLEEVVWCTCGSHLDDCETRSALLGVES